MTVDREGQSQHTAQDGEQQQQRKGWNQVVRRRKPVQYGTSQVKVTGGEAAPYDVLVGNTHPDTTEETLKDVLVKVSESMPENMKEVEPLEILEV